jgi:hypothetical protein
MKLSRNQLIIIGIVIYIYLAFGIEFSIPMPDYANVYVNDTTKTYMPPVFITDVTHLRMVTAKEAYKLKYVPDKQAKTLNGFTQADRTLTGKLLESIGIFKPLKSRWNQDGSWNW